MGRALGWAGAVALLAAAALGHEHWIVLGEPGAGGRAEIRIGSGHGFPHSELLLAERLLAGTEIVAPDGKAQAYKPTAEAKTWTAAAFLDKPGVWGASFSLKKPQESAPLYRGRCLRVVGGSDDPARYACGKDLEIVPGAPLSTLKTGDLLPVSIRVDGTQVEGTVAVTPEKGVAALLSTGRNRPAQVRITAAGLYLLTATHKGRTFALTFFVPAAAAVAP
jgi:hypothetical protein